MKNGMIVMLCVLKNKRLVMKALIIVVGITRRKTNADTESAYYYTGI